MLSSWHSFEEHDLCKNGHVQNLGVKSTKGLDGSIFFSVFLLELYQLSKKKLKRVINFTGSGLLWTQLGLCILHSAGARVKLIKDADIKMNFCLN